MLRSEDPGYRFSSVFGCLSATFWCKSSTKLELTTYPTTTSTCTTRQLLVFAISSVATYYELDLWTWSAIKSVWIYQVEFEYLAPRYPCSWLDLSKKQPLESLQVHYWPLNFLPRASSKTSLNYSTWNPNVNNRQNPLNTISIVYFLQTRLFAERFSWTITFHPGIFLGRALLACLSADEHRVTW